MVAAGKAQTIETISEEDSPDDKNMLMRANRYHATSTQMEDESDAEELGEVSGTGLEEEDTAGGGAEITQPFDPARIRQALDIRSEDG